MKNRKSDDSDDEAKFVYVDRSNNRVNMAVPLGGTTPPPEWVVDRDTYGKGRGCSQGDTYARYAPASKGRIISIPG